MKIEIYGDYVDGDAYAEEISPTKFREQVARLKKDEPLEVHVNSLGGSVTAGIAIANTIRDISKKGHRTTCVIDGVAASIASITAMACDEIVMYPSSFLMIHNPWTALMGDAATLRKEADTLDKMRQALLSFYRSRFDRTDSEIVAMMDAETWISGEEAEGYGLKVTILEDVAKSRAAAKATLKKVYNIRISEGIKNMTNEEIKPEEVKPTEEIVEEKPVEETKVAEATVEEVKPEEPGEETTEEHEPTVEELKAKIAELEKKLADLEEPAGETPIEEKPDEDVEARVAKCQSVFQKKINDLKCEMQSRDEELRQAKADVSRLEGEIKDSAAELAKAQAAEADAKNALANLTGGALNSTEVLPTFAEGLAKCKTPEERSRFVASGKFVK